MKRVISCAQLIAFGVVASRLRHGIDPHPPVSAFAEARDVTVSVVVPARNESLRLGRCLDAINNHMKPDELIVVDDSSTDDTVAVAREHGATVVSAPPLPNGWVGKPWGLEQGLQAATSEVVIFLDADVWARDGLRSALVAALDDLEVVSLATRLVSASQLEQAIHASMLTTLIYRFGPVGRKGHAPVNRIMANGQCVAANRKWLLNRGGFRLAAANMTDDIALFRALAKRGARVGFLDGSHVVDVCMYASARETWDEWPRSLPMVDVTSRTDQAFDTAVLWLTIALPTLRLIAGRATRVDKVLLMQRLAMTFAVSRAYRAPRIGVWLSPLCDVGVIMRLTKTVFWPVREWRGRSYGHLKNADQ